MSETTTTTTTEATPSAPKQKQSKPAKKPASKKATNSKQKPKGKATAKASGDRKSVSGRLNNSQLYILRVLKKTGKVMTRPEIAEVVPKVGGTTSNGRVSDEAGNYGALVKDQYIRVRKVPLEEGMRDVEHYEITALGKKRLEEAEKSRAEKAKSKK